MQGSTIAHKATSDEGCVPGGYPYVFQIVVLLLGNTAHGFVDFLGGISVMVLEVVDNVLQ